MKSGAGVQKIALISATIVFVAVLVLLRMRNWVPFALGVFTYLAVLAAFYPKRRRLRKVKLPSNVRQEDFDLALQKLSSASARLRSFIRRAPAADGPLFSRLAELLDTIRGHHEANPGHVAMTRNFLRHSLTQMIGSISDYVELAERSGEAQSDRLAEVSRGFEDYVPALEKIDQACLDNDLTELEISVDVLNTQMDRKR